MQVSNIRELVAHLRLDRLIELNLSFPARKLGLQGNCPGQVGRESCVAQSGLSTWLNASLDTAILQAILDRLPICRTLRVLRLANWQLAAAVVQQVVRLGPDMTSLDLSGKQVAAGLPQAAHISPISRSDPAECGTPSLQDAKRRSRVEQLRRPCKPYSL